jgi:hyperosmotically inducible protein
MKTFILRPKNQPTHRPYTKSTICLDKRLHWSFLHAEVVVMAGKRFAAMALSGLLFGQVLLVASETDENLEASARGSYVFRQLLAEEALSIEVNNGVVTLRGSVETALQRDLAEEAAVAHAGVRSVDNQITVRPAAPNEADALLARTLKTVLGWHRSGRPTVSKLEVKDGVVTLRGEALDEPLRALAAEYASGIEGVKGVKNEMTLKPSGPADEPSEPQKPAEARPGAAQVAAAEVDDPSVAAQVRMALRAHGPTRGLKLGLEVREGVLTLTGDTATEEERETAARLVADIHGVRRLVNKMTSQPESTGQSSGSGAASAKP